MQSLPYPEFPQKELIQDAYDGPRLDRYVEYPALDGEQLINVLRKGNYHMNVDFVYDGLTKDKTLLKSLMRNSLKCIATNALREMREAEPSVQLLRISLLGNE